jgi:hypothetical protein
MTTKEALHRLVDAIPERELDAAAAALEPLVDPVLAAFLNAPLDDELETPEEAAAVADAKQNPDPVPWEAYRAERQAGGS